MITLSRSFLFALLALSVPLAWADPPAATAVPAAEAAAAVAPAAAPAAAPAPPPAPSTTEPSVILNSQINSGDTAWMLASMALVLMMTVPGLALFYGGMVRKKNVLATLMQSFAITCLVTLLWYVIGYSLAFTPGSTPYLGGWAHSLLDTVSYMKEAGKTSVSHIASTIPETVFAMFQLTFAIITPALICGSFAERMK